MNYSLKISWNVFVCFESHVLQISRSIGKCPFTLRIEKLFFSLLPYWYWYWFCDSYNWHLGIDWSYKMVSCQSQFGVEFFVFTPYRNLRCEQHFILFTFVLKTFRSTTIIRSKSSSNHIRFDTCLSIDASSYIAQRTGLVFVFVNIVMYVLCVACEQCEFNFFSFFYLSKAKRQYVRVRLCMTLNCFLLGYCLFGNE